MASRAVRIGALAGALSGGLSGCLDANPKFVEPMETGGSTGSGTSASPTAPTTDMTTTTSTTTPPPTTTGETTDTTVATTAATSVGETTTTTTTGVSTGVQPVCGDGVVEEDEECDDGDDDAANGCFGCVIPRTCLHLKAKADELGVGLMSGFYEIDLDGDEPLHVKMLVRCDMDTPPGGWTVVERSGLGKAVGRPLFDPPPPPFNETMPQVVPYRMRGKDIAALVAESAEMRIDCGGPDFLLTSAMEFKAGEGVLAMPCDVFVSVDYVSASVKGVPYSGKLCTGMFGKEALCEGAWHVSEQAQMQELCVGPPYPWSGKVTMGANLFAVDPKIPDMQGPVHDCHKVGAVREVKLR